MKSLREIFRGIFIRKRSAAAICFGLAAVTVLVYLPMLRDNFINYDDPDYILGNAHVNHGLTWNGIVWAFTSSDAANWHPLTWISHMMDCQFFGLHPAGHHLMNLLFHTANALLLFLLLKNMTGAIWRSAFVAAAFRVASPARGIGRLGLGAQGCLERILLDALAAGVCEICSGLPIPPAFGPRLFQYPAAFRAASSQVSPIPDFTVLLAGPVFLRRRFDVQADGGDAAIRPIVAGFLAIETF